MTTNLLPERPTYIVIVLVIVLAMISAAVRAQTPYKDCGYSDAPPTWVQVTRCATIAAGKMVATDLIIEGNDTTRIRTVKIAATGKYAIIQHTYVPTSNQCQLIVCKKIFKCL